VASAKEIVQAKYPYAYAYQWSGPKPWVIYATRPLDPGHVGEHLSPPCATAEQAWAAAAAKAATQPEDAE
jgi:hypothetical protein